MFFNHSSIKNNIFFSSSSRSQAANKRNGGSSKSSPASYTVSHKSAFHSPNSKQSHRESFYGCCNIYCILQNDNIFGFSRSVSNKLNETQPYLLCMPFIIFMRWWWWWWSEGTSNGISTTATEHSKWKMNRGETMTERQNEETERKK